VAAVGGHFELHYSFSVQMQSVCCVRPAHCTLHELSCFPHDATLWPVSVGVGMRLLRKNAKKIQKIQKELFLEFCDNLYP
jgi:hypothetical protein